MIADRLRKSILQAAIQGKLTEQLPEDDNARDLLAEIKAEKAKLVKEGKIKKEIPLPEITEDEIPFDIPKNWCWCRIGQVFTLQAGRFTSSDSIRTEGKYPCYGGNGLRGYVDTYNRSGRFPIIGRQGALCGNINIADGEFYATEHAVVVHGYCNCVADWAAYFLDALNLNQYATATAQPGLAVNKIDQVVFPLPPINEQQRIVEQLKKIFPEINKLKIDEAKLDTVQKSFPKKMKDSILQSAIQGKLTEQLESDGDACDLVKEIQKEKERLIQEGKIKKEKPLLEITEDEIPFDIPDNWCWVRLGEISEYIQRGKSPEYSSIEKYPVVSQKCNQWDGFHIEKAQFINPDSVISYGKERLLCEEDLLWNSTGLGTLGRMAIYENEKNPYGFAVTDSHVTVIRLFINHVLPRYVFSYIVGPYIQSIVEDISSGSTKQKELATDTVKKLLIPIPPLPEQHRIVKRLNQLFPFLDAL